MNNLYKSIILLLILLTIGVAYYNYRTNTYVTAEFKNLRPFHDRAPIYYNGFKIGRVVNVKPNKNYTATIVTMELHPDDLKLPINISVNLRKERNKWNRKFDYIDIIYPKEPSSFYLKNGDRVSGKTTVEFESYFANMDPESLEAMKGDAAEAVKNLNITIQTLGELFGTLNTMAQEVSPNVVKVSSDMNKSSGNIVKVSENVSNMTGNVDSALSKERMEATAKNAQLITRNVKNMTNEFNKTIPQIGCTINEMNRILCNIDEMTAGLNNTMEKPFGGLRLIFGSPVSKKKCHCK